MHIEMARPLCTCCCCASSTRVLPLLLIDTRGEARLSLDGTSFNPAVIEGNADVFNNPHFIMEKRGWQPDQEAVTCPLCKCKFGGLKRRHHCRQCGLVVCNKCCNEKVPLPQLGIEEPERVCEACRPVTSAVTKSRVLEKTQPNKGKILMDGLSALTIYCKSQAFLNTVLDSGGLSAILPLCRCPDGTVALMAVSLLSVLLENPATHAALVDGRGEALRNLLSLVNVDNAQEDFSCGRPLLAVVRTETINMQVWANAACLVANLATSQEDQTSLAENRDALLDIVKSDVTNFDLLRNVIRGIANFAKFQQNSAKILSALPHMSRHCMTHEDVAVRLSALRAVLHLLQHETEATLTQLLIEGASDMLRTLTGAGDVMNAMFAAISQTHPDLSRPL
ncbi:ZFY21-like protein [Mya arenaria]|uniref:ZFY21-like protein n=1 Tax=Mya arenaria TaxID=6604 RepID=A0ABY7DMW4_MYAAR|nr:ZFY21-like protein [Mya arenaria]